MPSDNDTNPFANTPNAYVYSDAGDENTNENADATVPATFYLTGLRLDGRRDRPDFYTFLIEQNGPMLPLLADGQVIFFTNLSLAGAALRAAGIEVTFKTLTFENVYLVDVSQTLYLLQTESNDERKIIANTLDLFARILTNLGVGVPPVFGDALIELGNYVDQNTFYGDFIEQKKITRARAIDAVRWCLGTTLSLARIITEETQ